MIMDSVCGGLRLRRGGLRLRDSLRPRRSSGLWDPMARQAGAEKGRPRAARRRGRRRAAARARRRRRTGVAANARRSGQLSWSSLRRVRIKRTDESACVRDAFA